MRRLLVLLLLTSIVSQKTYAKEKNYFLGLEFVITFGKVLKLPIEDLNIPEDKEDLGAWTYGVILGNKINRSKIVFDLLYCGIDVPKQPQDFFKEEILIASLNGTYKLLKINRTDLSGAFGYEAYSFKSTDLQDRSRVFRTSDHAPMIGLSSSIILKEHDPTAFKIGKISRSLFKISYKYSNSKQPLHMLKLSILIGVSKNRYGIFNFYYLYNKGLYKTIVLTFGGYGFIG